MYNFKHVVKSFNLLQHLVCATDKGKKKKEKKNVISSDPEHRVHCLFIFAMTIPYYFVLSSFFLQFEYSSICF